MKDDDLTGKSHTFHSLEELQSFLGVRDERETEKLRPVLLLTMDDPVLNGGYQRPHVDLRGLASSIALSGYSAKHACRDDKAADLCCFDFPKIKWENVPAIAAPKWNLSFYSVRQLDENGAVSKTQTKIEEKDVRDVGNYSRLLRERVKVLVLASYELTDHYLAKILLPWIDVEDDGLPSVIHHGPDGGAIVPLDRLVLARERFSTELRFLYNYASNFCTLANRALFKIYMDEDLDKFEAASRLFHISMYSWRSAHPIFLQILHNLKALGHVGTHEHRKNLAKQVSPFSYAHFYGDGLPMFDKVDGCYEFQWSGTGKYQEWRLPMGRALQAEEIDHDAYSSHFVHEVFKTFQHVERAGLLGLDGDTIVLSPWGVQFLELLGPCTNDPDVLLRWRRGGDEIGSLADVEAMDEWIERVFSQAKERVDSFLNGVEAELCDDVEFLKTTALSIHKLSVLGIQVPITLEDLECPVFRKEIDLLAEHEEKVSIDARNYGLVYQPPKMKTESKISGFWVGVPLAITHGDPIPNEPTWLKNTSKERLEALEAIKLLPPALRRRLEGQQPRIIHGIPTAGPLGELRSLDWNLASGKADNLQPIIFGVISSVDLRSQMSSFFRQRLKTFNLRPGIPEYFDGVNLFRAGRSELVTTTCGYFVGLYNEEDDTFFIDGGISAERIEAFESKKSEMFANLKGQFAIHRSDEGYWAILKDGSAKRIIVPLSS